ncbi:MAG: lipopolysaccharide kinase InaA family protein [Candidatus Brocadiia bacterium]
MRTRGLPPEEFPHILAAHRAAPEADVLKNGRRSTVTRVPSSQGQVCVKEYRVRGLVDMVKDRLRGSRARHAWQAAEALVAQGVSVPEPLGLAKRGRCGYFLTRHIEGAATLKDLFSGRFAQAEAPQELGVKRRLLGQLGRWLRAVHDRGVYHDDWSPKNILAREGPQGWRFYLLDMESAWPPRRLTRRRRAKNLAQVSDVPRGATATDKMRVLLAYAGRDATLTRGLFPSHVQALARRRQRQWEKVQKRALKRKTRLRRKAKSGPGRKPHSR